MIEFLNKIIEFLSNDWPWMIIPISLIVLIIILSSGNSKKSEEDEKKKKAEPALKAKAETKKKLGFWKGFWQNFIGAWIWIAMILGTAFLVYLYFSTMPEDDGYQHIPLDKVEWSETVYMDDGDEIQWKTVPVEVKAKCK